MARIKNSGPDTTLEHVDSRLFLVGLPSHLCNTVPSTPISTSTTHRHDSRHARASWRPFTQPARHRVTDDVQSAPYPRMVTMTPQADNLLLQALALNRVPGAGSSTTRPLPQQPGRKPSAPMGIHGHELLLAARTTPAYECGPMQAGTGTRTKCRPPSYPQSSMWKPPGRFTNGAGEGAMHTRTNTQCSLWHVPSHTKRCSPRSHFVRIGTP